MQVQVTSIRLSFEGKETFVLSKDRIFDIRELVLDISISGPKEMDAVISTLNEASFLDQLNDKCKKNDIFTIPTKRYLLPTNEFKRLKTPVSDEIKGSEIFLLLIQ